MCLGCCVSLRRAPAMRASGRSRGAGFKPRDRLGAVGLGSRRHPLLCYAVFVPCARSHTRRTGHARDFLAARRAAAGRFRVRFVCQCLSEPSGRAAARSKRSQKWVAANRTAEVNTAVWPNKIS